MCGQDRPSGSRYQTQACFKPVDKKVAKEGDLVVEEFPISFGGYDYIYGRIAYVVGNSPAPVILVHHNYAGLKQFDIDQACFLAKVGYVGLAVESWLLANHVAYQWGQGPTSSIHEVDWSFH